MPAAPQIPSSFEQQVIRVIAQTQRIPVETITLDSTFEQLKIDSLDGINIVFALENEFGIEIPDEGVHRMRSIREITTGVQQLLGDKARGASPGVA